jgi:hypothetical protein
MTTSQPQQQPARHDGRLSPWQLRDSVLARQVHSRADGSALWRQGNTAVLAAVYGPRPPASLSSEDSERCVVEVAWRPRSGGAPGPRERALELAVARCAQGALLAGQHPRGAVLVALQVLSDDGGALACGVNAACAAMVDAGLPMAFMFGAVACALGVGGGGGGGGGGGAAATTTTNPTTSAPPQLLLDPDADEEAKASAVLVVAYPYRAVLLGDAAAAATSGSGQGDDGDGDNAAKQQQKQVLRVSEGALAVEMHGRAADEALALGMTACRRGVESLAAFARDVVAEGVARGGGAAAAAAAAGAAATAAATGAPPSAKKARAGGGA